MTHNIVYEMTYNVSSGTLNPAIPIPVVDDVQESTSVLCAELRMLTQDVVRLSNADVSITSIACLVCRWHKSMAVDVSNVHCMYVQLVQQMIAITLPSVKVKL